jgi:hypothetical protein
MITLILLLCLLSGFLCTLVGWALHRNFQPYKDPTDWYYYHPFKSTDSLAVTIVKGMAGGLFLAGMVAGCSLLLGWLIGADGWKIAFWMLVDLNFVGLFMEGRLIFVRLRWWWYYLDSGARRRLRLSWQRDGYSAF